MKEYYKIGEISSLYNIGTDSLRYYEEIGILKPQRDVNGYRMYSINDIRTLNILRELRSIGFSMSEIKNHIQDFNLEKTVELFSKAISAIDQKVAEMNRLRAQLSERIDEINRHISEDFSDKGIEVVHIPERRILKLSENVIRDDDLDFVIKKLQSEYEDQLYIIGNGDIGATLPVDYLKGGKYGHFDSAFYIVDEDEEYDSVIPEGDYLSVTVKGGYAQIADIWQRIISYADNNSLSIDDTAIELYIIDNHDTADENEYITQLQVRIV